jgi:hypothetical protein
MHQINGPNIESKEEFQIRMNEGRHLMAGTMGEMKHELSEAVDWKTYVQHHPGTCLLAGGALGWILGRKLRSFRQSPLSSSQPELPSESSTFSRTADKVVSSVLAEALPLIAARMRRFSNVPDKE